MKRPARTFGVLALCVASIYVSIFPVAELFMEIAVLRTYDGDGTAFETRVTVLDRRGSPWIRGRPERQWFQRLRANPIAELRRDGEWKSVHAAISNNPADAEAFQRIAIERYGLAYRYCDLIAQMYRNEVPIRLSLARSPAPPLTNKSLKGLWYDLASTNCAPSSLGHPPLAAAERPVREAERVSEPVHHLEALCGR